VAKLSDKDWGKIHAKAWLDPKFRALLERDPTQAIRAYEKSEGYKPGYFDKIVRVGDPPSKKTLKKADKALLESAAPWPPWCC
jgi:hypothetical protein